MIYTASYFSAPCHHGKLFSISRSNPKEFSRIPRLEFFTPSKSLLDWWKGSEKSDSDWQEYSDRFLDELDENFKPIQDWCETQFQQHRKDISLLCWEPAGDRCHRYAVGELIKNRLPHLWGGDDVPQTWVEQRVSELNEKGLAVRCDRLSLAEKRELHSISSCNSVLFVYQLFFGKKSLGDWTQAGAENMLSQLLHPTNPVSWFRSMGLDSTELEAIQHYSLNQKPLERSRISGESAPAAIQQSQRLSQMSLAKSARRSKKQRDTNQQEGQLALF